MPFSLIVFDLDFTLWNAGGTWCDHTAPPYQKINNHVIDSENNSINLYPDVKSLLNDLSKYVTLAVASRTYRPEWARELLQLFEIEKYFSYMEIYPGSKQEHFNHLQHQTKIPFAEMLFFDDEMRNVDEVAKLGVSTVLVDEGITSKMVSRYYQISRI
jgi:magnesium-dependent phosphatase 1